MTPSGRGRSPGPSLPIQPWTALLGDPPGLTPRSANDDDEASEALGSTRASIDISPYVALILLLVIVAEAGLRLRLGLRPKLAGAGPSEPASRAS